MKRTDKFLEFGKDNVFFLDQQTNVDYIAIEPVIRFFGAKYFLELGELYKSFIADEMIFSVPFSFIFFSNSSENLKVI